MDRHTVSFLLVQGRKESKSVRRVTQFWLVHRRHPLHFFDEEEQVPLASAIPLTYGGNRESKLVIWYLDTQCIHDPEVW